MLAIVSHPDGEGQEGPIDAIKTPDEIRAEPYRLPPGFQWVDIDVNDEKDVLCFWFPQSAD